MFSSLYNKHISTQQPSLMSFTALSVMEQENPPCFLAPFVLAVPRLPSVERGVHDCRNPGRGQFGWGIVCSAGWSSIMGLSSFPEPFK